MFKLMRIEKEIIAPKCWQDIPWGEHYRQEIELRFEPWLSKIFGFHLLKLGNLSTEIDSRRCGINHQIKMARAGENLNILGDSYQIPLVEKSIDACIIAHTLPYISYPHPFLREIDRVLVDDGWLLLSTFNSVSLLGLAKLLPLLRHKSALSFHAYSHMRLVDWLTLLNYEILSDESFQILPWCQQGGGGFINRHLPGMGCLNVMVARKRTIPLTMTPLRSKRIQFAWRRGTVGATKLSKIAVMGKDKD